MSQTRPGGGAGGAGRRRRRLGRAQVVVFEANRNNDNLFVLPARNLEIPSHWTPPKVDN